MEHTITETLFTDKETLTAAPIEGIDTPTVGELNAFRNVEPVIPVALSLEKLNAIASGLVKAPVTLLPRPALDLSPRRPYEVNGLMDLYHCGRWDCTYDILYVNGIKTGPNPGNWDGTVGYVQFKAPSEGTFFFVVTFSGYQTTMRLNGPWGITTAYTPTTSDTAAVTALWPMKAGAMVYPTFSCIYPAMGYVSSVKVYRLS